MKQKLLWKRWMKRSRIAAMVILIVTVSAITLRKAPEKEREAPPVSPEAVSALPEREEPEQEAPMGEEAAETAARPASSQSEEMRAVWVPFMTLAMEGDRSESAFREKFAEIAENSRARGMNALIVQVRPFSDALYPSELYPWSHILSGEQGKDPGFDPLAVMTEIAHEEGLALHAWVNPLRVSTGQTPERFAENSPGVLWRDGEHSGWLMETEAGVWMNPACAGVRRYIAEGVSEIVRHYPVDGVQFDDYFYPAGEDYDRAEYEAYCAGEETPLSLHDWRQANISSLVAEAYAAVKKEDPEAVFGISPQGNLENVYNACADVYTWGAVCGYADYLCPQMYVSTENPALPFEDTLRTWRELVSNEKIRLYAGLAVYKAGTDADGGAWQGRNDIISTELALGREIACDGFMFYSYDYLVGEAAEEEVANVMKTF